MDFFNQTYVALRGPTGAVQTPADTIARLSDRLSPATLLADRRAAVLSLKGLSRDWKEDVGARALPGLIDVLTNDAEVDPDIGKAVLETLNILCDTEDAANNAKTLGFKHTDIVLATDRAAHALFSLLRDTNFYTRFSSLQLLSTLLHNRRQLVQGYFLTAPAGPGSIIGILDDKREIIRNEAISVIQTLISQSPEIQKVLTFEGAFEKFFNIITQEGSIEGGVVTHGALTCVDGLLRFNSSNQSYFKETPLFPVISQLLQFPLTLKPSDPAPQEFALQFWDDPKLANAALVVGIMGIFVGSKSSGVEVAAFSRCFLEIALASNAPTQLKVQALRLLPPNISFGLSEITITPYMPVPETNGEEWDRLEPASVLDALVEVVLHGEYNGLDGGKRNKEGLELRTAAAVVIENLVRIEEVRLAIVQAMAPSETGQPAKQITPLLHALILPLTSSAALDPANVTSAQMANFLFAHLLRSSPRTKSVARSIMPQQGPPTASDANFFVPADGAPPPAPPDDDVDDDPPQSLLQILSENLSLALLARSRPDTSDKELREWDRLVVAYISLLSQWLWEEPGSVRDFLDAGGLSVLVEGINQASEVDSFVPGLCTFLLGICYEFNREPGEITRKTIHPILGRLGIDSLVGQLTRFREDDRFRAVGPDLVVLTHPAAAISSANESARDEAEVWFDWAFVDFWKSNYYTIQRAFSTDPDQLSTSSSGPSAESAMLIASLRDVIRKQSEEIETLRNQLQEMSSNNAKQAADLQNELSDARLQLRNAEEKRKDVEKEQEDLLVLLDEVTSKRKRDKARMRDASLEVSEDEEDEDGEDDE